MSTTIAPEHVFRGFYNLSPSILASDNYLTDIINCIRTYIEQFNRSGLSSKNHIGPNIFKIMALFLLNKWDTINQNNTNELTVLTPEFKVTILLELVGIDKSCIWFNNERNILVSNCFHHFFF